LYGEQEGVFTDLHQLNHLSLAFNVISSIEPHVFDESANLTSLTYINLSHNRMTELEPWPLALGPHHKQKYVPLSYNRIANFTNALRWSFDCNSTKSFRTLLELSYNDISHMTDVFRGWNIDGKLSYKVSLQARNQPLQRRGSTLDAKGVQGEALKAPSPRRRTR